MLGKQVIVDKLWYEKLVEKNQLKPTIETICLFLAIYASIPGIEIIAKLLVQASRLHEATLWPVLNTEYSFRNTLYLPKSHGVKQTK